jgi:hypothetical protein
MRNLVARTAVGTMFLAVLFFGGPPICAEFITFTGIDSNAGPGQPRPNSAAAAFRFEVAAATFGDLNLIDLESAPLGDFSSLLVAPGITVRKANSGSGSGVVTTPSTTQGYNTTAGGERYLRGTPSGVDLTVPATFTFTFDEPIQAFGTYLTGSPNGVPSVGSLQIAFADGTSRALSLPSHTSGVSFFGFLDTEAPISEVTLRAGPGFVPNRNAGTLEPVRKVRNSATIKG